MNTLQNLSNVASISNIINPISLHTNTLQNLSSISNIYNPISLHTNTIQQLSSISNIYNPVSLSTATMNTLQNLSNISSISNIINPITLHTNTIQQLSSISNIYNPVSLHTNTLQNLSSISNIYNPVSLHTNTLQNLSSISNIYNPVSLSTATMNTLQNLSNVASISNIINPISLHTNTLQNLSSISNIYNPISLHTNTLQNLSSISNIYNPISLSAATLTALENVTVDSVVAPISLSAATLTALENVTVDSIVAPVSLHTNTLQNLSSISNIYNPIEISTKTLSSLSNYEIDLTNTTIYGRYRMVKPTILFSVHHSLGSKSLFMDTLISGSATSTRNDTISSQVLQVTATAGKVIYQTNEYFSYSCGQSKLTYISAVLQVASASGTRSRVGVFDDNVGKTVDTRGNGFFFEYYQNLLYVVYRTSSDGTTGTDTRIVQSSWNYDHLDGAGYSGFNINPNLVNTFAIEFNTMGDDIARMGVVYKGQIRWCHIFDFSALAYPYLLTFKLPVRWELENVSSGAVTTQLYAIACSVMIEGDVILNQSNMIHGTFTELAARVVTAASWFSMVCFRLNPTGTGQRRTFAIKKLTMVSAALAFQWRLVYGGTVAGSTWVNVANNTDSFVQTSITNTAYGTGVTTGYPYASGFQNTISTTIHEFSYPYPVTLNASVAGTSDTITLEVHGLAAATNVYYAIDWVEYY
jgi:hypothetical protein